MATFESSRALGELHSRVEDLECLARANRQLSNETMFTHTSHRLLLLVVTTTTLLLLEAVPDLLAPNDPRILGVCSRPQLPPNARFRTHSAEKTKFAENETIFVLCKDNEFPTQSFKRICRHGGWQGEQARCAKGVTKPIVRLEMFKCLDMKRPLLRYEVNMTVEPPHPLPPNSFHFSRLPEDTDLGVRGSDCYKWRLQLESSTEIALMVVDVSTKHLPNDTTRPILIPRVKRRTCRLQHQSYQLVAGYDVYGNYFYCDLDVEVNATEFDVMEHNTDFILLDVEFEPKRALALDAVFIGSTYKKIVGNNKRELTDCGKLEIERAGVLEQTELGYSYITCNASMIDVSPKLGLTSGRDRYRYVCDANGMWRGRWPKCVPRKMCPKEEITTAIDKSVVVEAVGNVYFVNDTEWQPIDHSWVSYACASFDGLMIGKPQRQCLDGRWSNFPPRCTRAISEASALPFATIISIAVAIVIAFALIVYLAIQYHTKQIQRKLEATRTEIEQSALNKALTGDYYAGGAGAVYEDVKDLYAVPAYEMSDVVRYESSPRTPREPEYLAMTEGDRRERLYQNSQ